MTTCEATPQAPSHPRLRLSQLQPPLPHRLRSPLVRLLRRREAPSLAGKKRASRHFIALRSFSPRAPRRRVCRHQEAAAACASTAPQMEGAKVPQPALAPGSSPHLPQRRMGAGGVRSALASTLMATCRMLRRPALPCLLLQLWQELKALPHATVRVATVQAPAREPRWACPAPAAAAAGRAAWAAGGSPSCSSRSAPHAPHLTRQPLQALRHLGARALRRPDSVMRLTSLLRGAH